MRKKILSILSAASILVTAAVCHDQVLKSGKSSFGFASSNEIWGHYQCLEPDFNHKGIKEYWISCSTHQISFTKPDVSDTQIQERSALSLDFLNSLDPSDSRILPKYKVLYDFEDGVVPHEFEAGRNVSSLAIDNTNGVGGTKCLKVNISASDFFYGLSKSYLDAAFTDTSVKSIKFDAKANKASANFRHNTHFGRNDDLISNTFESNTGVDTNWKTFYFTRGMYNEWRDASTMLKAGGFTSGDYILIDNIELSQRQFDSSTYDYDYVGFETGNILAKDGSGNTSVRAGIGNKQIALVSGGGHDTVTFSYDKHTEGNRSLCISKLNGYMAIFLSSQLYSAIDSNGIYVDLFTDSAFNSYDSNKGMTDGCNNPFNMQHPAGRWVTYHLTKSQIGTDGRFLIFQGSPTGNIYIDNVRPATGIMENFESSYSVHLGQYATSANFEVTSENYNTIRDNWKDYNVVVNGANISDTSISFDHPENWHHRAMKVTYSNGGYCAIFLNPNFVAENVDKGISFDIYSEGEFTPGNSFANQVNSSLNQWKTVTLIGEDLYDPARPGEEIINGRIFAQSFLRSGSFYIDNIRSANMEAKSIPTYYDLDFERGTVETIDSSSRTCNYNYNGITEFKATGNTSYLTSMEIADAPFGREGHALKVTKNSGYVAFYLNSSLYSSMGNNDILSFDIYSTIMANSKSGVNNITNGNNGLFAGEDYAHPANKWVTYKFKKADMGSDGRFLIIQGSTAGDWYFDNFKVRTETSYVDLGSYYPTPEGKIDLNLGRSIPTNSVVTVDEKPVYYEANGNLISIYAASLTNGEHVLRFKTFSNKYNHNEYSYYFASYKETSQQKTNITLTYGSNGYQTFSDLGNVNRVVFDGQSIAYEKSGEDIIIPDAALIECLSTVAGSKTSGQVQLTVLSNSKNSKVTRLIVNITLSGSAQVKSGYNNFTDETYGCFGYSSTGAGTSKNLNYEDQLMEYKRAGFEDMYEQLINLPVDLSENFFSNYRFNDNRVYQDLVRCRNLGLGVLVADMYTNKLCNETSSIYGRSITLSSATSVNFASTNDLYTALYNRYQPLAEFENLKQIVLCDEPFYPNLVATGEVYKQARKAMDDLGRNDVEINVNLLPISAGYGDGGIGPQPSYSLNYISNGTPKKKHDAYVTYLNKWISESGADYIQYDMYPLNTYAAEDDGDNSSNRSGIDKFNMLNIVTAAEYCKSNNKKLKVVTQACTLPGRAEGTNTRLLSIDDMRYNSNMLMGYGVKQISYFVYYARHSSGESYNQQGSFMYEHEDGTGITERTDVWYEGQTVINEMNDFAKVALNFDYVATNLVENGSYVNQGCNYDWADIYDVDKFTSFGVLTGGTIDNGYAVFNALKDSSNKYMYMVQNFCDPLLDQRLQNITMTFSSGTYAQVFENGTSRIVNLVSNKLDLKLSSGNAAFVIIY